ncbi:MAG: hypothetical protein ACI8TP_000670 [Acidimicrobiales bacterium]|jgi:hypothetical protein
MPAYGGFQMSVYRKRRRLWLLIPSYLIGPETWRGVDEVLNLLGQATVLPKSVRTKPGDADHIGPWLKAVLDAMPKNTGQEVVVVGHSAACPRLPMVADALLQAEWDVESVILVNGRFPAEDGMSPVDADKPLAAMLDDLMRPDDYVPPWYLWWGGMIRDMLLEEDRERVFSEAMPMPRALFDQAIPVPVLPDSVERAFLATGDMYAMGYERALEEGWHVARLDGEHLHLVVDPVTVAGTLLSLVGRPKRSTEHGPTRQ